MKLPRKGILVRIVIYGGAFAYVGYAALMRCQAERRREEEALQEPHDLRESTRTRMITLPDGSQMPVVELTQAEYDAMVAGSKAAAQPNAAPDPDLDPTPTGTDEHPRSAPAN